MVSQQAASLGIVGGLKFTASPVRLVRTNEMTGSHLESDRGDMTFESSDCGVLKSNGVDPTMGDVSSGVRPFIFTRK